MANEDEIKAAEARGYSKGYNAGRKKVKRERQEEHRRRNRDALFNRAFLAALPACIEVTGWTRGEKPITSLTDKVALAKRAADEAMTYLRW